MSAFLFKSLSRSLSKNTYKSLSKNPYSKKLAGLKCLSLCFLLLSLAGCSRSTPEYLLEDYLYRLGNLLEEDIDTDLDLTGSDSGSGAGLLVLYPRQRERVFDLVPLSQGLIEVLDLGYCEGLLNLVAARNSNLGKVMAPSQTLAYEQAFLTSINRCVNQAKTDPTLEPELYTTLLHIQSHKQQQFPYVIANAIYAAPEWVAQFSIGEPAMPVSQKSDGQGGNEGQALDWRAYFNALEQLNELSVYADTETELGKVDQAKNSKGNNEGKSKAREQDIKTSWMDTPEQPYQQLYTLPYGGQTLKSVAMLTLTMERGTQAINQRLARKAFCRKGLANKRKEILGNVFTQYYVGRFQPYLASVDQPYQQTADILTRIFTRVPSTDAVGRYFEQVWMGDQSDKAPSLRARYKNARQAHIKAWQALLGQCGMMPSKTG